MPWNAGGPSGGGVVLVSQVPVRSFDPLVAGGGPQSSSLRSQRTRLSFPFAPCCLELFWANTEVFAVAKAAPKSTSAATINKALDLILSPFNLIVVFVFILVSQRHMEKQNPPTFFT